MRLLRRLRITTSAKQQRTREDFSSPLAGGAMIAYSLAPRVAVPWLGWACALATALVPPGHAWHAKGSCRQVPPVRLWLQGSSLSVVPSASPSTRFAGPSKQLQRPSAAIDDALGSCFHPWFACKSHGRCHCWYYWASSHQFLFLFFVLLFLLLALFSQAVSACGC